jgi:uncharacterized protein (DUF58 family)
MRALSGLRTAVAGFGRRRSPLGGASSPESIVDGVFLSKIERLSLQIGKDLVAGLMGEHRATRRTSGIEFADHREYVPGDDLRRVDWNAYARLGTLHIRQSQAEHDTVLYLMLDASPSMEFGHPSKFYTARRLAAAVGYIALAHLDRVMMANPGADTSVPQGAVSSTHRWSGRAEAPLFFRHLQDMRPGGVADFGGILAEWGSGRGQGRAALLISDLLTDGYQAGLRQLVGAGFAVTVLHVLSPEEMSPPTIGDVELVDSETGQQIELNLGPESLAEYRRRLEGWLGETRAWAAANGVDYLLVGSDWNIERTMLKTLRLRELVS